MKILLSVSAFLLCLGAPLLVLAAAPAPIVGGPALVLSLPWAPNAAQVIARSGLVEISPERAPFGVLTTLNRQGDAQVLKRNGAWLVLDGRKVAELCGL